MQADQSQTGRQSLNLIAREISAQLIPVWDALDPESRVSPLLASGKLLEGLDPELLVDPWGNALTLEFSASTEIGQSSEEVLATIHSSGQDEEAGSTDDVALAILMDGQIVDAAMIENKKEK
jgi:hypothetical protein